jgi:hypothetical protein
VGFGDGQVADGVPYDEGIPMALAAFTDARRSDDEMRLEVLLAVAASITDGASMAYGLEPEEGVRGCVGRWGVRETRQR